MRYADLLLPLILFLVILGAVLIVRWKRRVASAGKGWPTAVGTIETGVYEQASSSEDSIQHLCVLTYSYRAGSRYFSGQVKVMVAEPEVADWLTERMRGQKVSIQFDPIHPSRSMFAENNIEGQVVYSNPFSCR